MPTIKFIEGKLDINDKELLKIQNFIPIYQNYYGNEKRDIANLSLSYPTLLKSVNKVSGSYNKFSGLSENGETIPLFIKFCPLLDPVKIMIGKISTTEFSLPALDDKEHIFSDPNNSAYADSFFSYLSSKLLHDHGMLNALDSFGSFLAVKKNFRVDIVDDVEYLFESSYFLEHKDEFNISDSLYEQFQPLQSCKYKKKINIIDDDENAIEVEVDELEVEDINVLPLTSTTLNMLNNSSTDEEVIYNNNEITNSKNNKTNTDSSCSSRSSGTTDDECNSSSQYEDISGSSSEYDCESIEDQPIYASLNELPINMVLLECCEQTLDDYIMSTEIDEKEWSAILFQIIMTLIVFQEKLMFIHNDLHTSNIMFVPTDKQFLYYRFNEIYYKVPTYGKIWKIIDFGRAIYKFKNVVIFSDSFSEKGDASTQYNCEPYLNPEKQIVPPNFSFDLCRLACSFYDYFDEVTHLDKIKDIVEDWMADDKGRNILYKKNGEERYEDFKLYKMISRTVHNAIPKDQLSRDIFKQYIVSRKNIKKKMDMVLKINEIPDFTV